MLATAFSRLIPAFFGNCFVAWKASASIFIEVEVDDRDNCLCAVSKVGVCEDPAQPILSPAIEDFPGRELLGELDDDVG
jgi:hypothetical protein